ncbi:TPA_asm: RNA-directed RNA polymerase, partial [ssRNA phage SRR7976323_3]
MKNSSTLHITAFAMMCRKVGSDYSNAVEKSLRENGFASIHDVAFPNFREYSTPDAFRDDYMIKCFLSKLNLSQDKEELTNKCIAQFKETELRLSTVNRNLRRGSAFSGVEGIISDARRKISSILGYGRPSKDSFNLNEFAEGVDWGPGATSTLNSRVATLDKKILEPQLSVTGRALRYALAYLRYDTNFVSARLGLQAEQCTLLPGEFHVTEHDRFTTVDKKWNARRSISIQPTMNLFLQKGVGKMIRRRLQRCGINLDDQSRNQFLASRAFEEGLATIDLANASNSVSTELVRLLLPSDWFDVLNDLRTHSTDINGEIIRLEMFSSMGNGFTFELESLIFYALCWAVVRSEANDEESAIAVYGDDIIVASMHASRLITVLSYCGFETNVDKTFVSGPFYESCGKHFFEGKDVSPIFQKKLPNDLYEIIRMHNRIFRWCIRGDHLDTRFRIILDILYQAGSLCMPFSQRKGTRLTAPRQPHWLEGDTGFCLNEKFRHDQNGIFRLWAVIFSSKKIKADNHALFSNTIRKGVVVDSPYKGLLSLRGVGKHQFG